MSGTYNNEGRVIQTNVSIYYVFDLLSFSKYPLQLFCYWTTLCTTCSRIDLEQLKVCFTYIESDSFLAPMNYYCINQTNDDSVVVIVPYFIAMKNFVRKSYPFRIEESIYPHTTTFDNTSFVIHTIEHHILLFHDHSF